MVSATLAVRRPPRSRDPRHTYRTIQEPYMTRSEPPDQPSDGQPKPSWGPGKNAALSVVAFAVIFGVFAYIEREPGIGRAKTAHDSPGMIGMTPPAPGRPAIAAAGAAASVPAATIAQAAPPASTVSAAAPRAQEAAQSAALAAAPRPATGFPRSSQARTATTAADAPAKGRHPDAHRTPRRREFANTRKRIDLAQQSPPTFASDAGRLQPASVTHDELEGARALARARSCMQINEWSCVEQNASRALAIDPNNSESRALLEQAIRNRL
ncbi:hypothetical protein [Burkholderia dolosa]|nr:hypothetical protein [Burkholderia dolosa]